MTQPILSIIIPVLNEAAIIVKTIARLQGNSDIEIIVVDGGSKDRTVTLAQQQGVKVITAAKVGRAWQMNEGAAIATGKILLFLHVDTQLPRKYLDLIYQTMAQPQVIAGAFELAIDGRARSLRVIEFLVKLRSRFLSLPYGDQALFVTQEVFKDMGGFADLPIMEDFEFVQRLKRRGKVAIAPASVITSGRRWQKLGVFKTTLINQLVILGYYWGISPIKLRNFYRRAGKTNFRK